MMAIFETADSTEVLLQLFYIAQGNNETGPRPDQLLAMVREYTRDHPRGQHPFAGYFTEISEMICPSRNCLPPLFVGDLKKLVSEELIAIREDGRVELTMLGTCLAYARRLPNPLRELGECAERLVSG